MECTEISKIVKKWGMLKKWVKKMRMECKTYTISYTGNLDVFHVMLSPTHKRIAYN